MSTPARANAGEPPDIDDLLPSPRYRIAAARIIAAPRNVVWAELTGIPMAGLPRGYALTLLRHLPGVLSSGERRVRGSDTFFEATPIPVVVEDAPRRIISAGPSQAWKLSGGATPPVLDAAAFATWNEPGWISVAMQFELTELPGGAGTLLSTETRIGIGDPRTARAFAPYWWAIKAGIGLIRREVIAAVGRRAEARAAGAPHPVRQVSCAR